MKLIQDDLVGVGQILVDEFGTPDLMRIVQDQRRMMHYREEGVLGKKLYVSHNNNREPIDRDSFVDLMASATVAREAQTILFPNGVAQDLIARENHGIFVGRLDMPFKDVIFQFTTPIDNFFPVKETNDFERLMKLDKDPVVALLVGRDGWPGQTDHFINTAIAVYSTLSVDRVAWFDDGTYNSDHPVTVNKLRLRYMAHACLMFVNARNVEIEHHATPEAVNRKRERKGKKPLRPYYTCTIRKEHVPAAPPVLPGGKHSFLYPVRGHFRHYKNGQTVWIVPHFRGLEHASDSMIPKIYRVQEPNHTHMKEST
jgi:hypothetical protein